MRESALDFRKRLWDAVSDAFPHPRKLPKEADNKGEHNYVQGHEQDDDNPGSLLVLVEAVLGLFGFTVLLLKGRVSERHSPPCNRLHHRFSSLAHA
jgi:hypothetical protein